MLRKDKEGYKYISENGIIYNLLEGLTFGNEKRFTSDIVFITVGCTENPIVGYFYGAKDFNAKKKEANEYIKKRVDEYEKKNFGLNKIIEAIKEFLEYVPSGNLEVICDVMDDLDGEVDGYYLAKRNGWGTIPLTSVLATSTMINEDELTSILNRLNIAYIF